MFSIVPRKVLIRLLVILPELLHDVLAHIAVLLLDLPGDLQLVFRRDIGHLSALTHEVEHELGDITTGDGDVLDGTPNNITLRAGNDVGNTVSGVDDGTRERAVGDTVGRPRGGKSKDSLNGDVETLDVE